MKRELLTGRPSKFVAVFHNINDLVWKYKGNRFSLIKHRQFSPTDKGYSLLEQKPRDMMLEK